MEKSPYEILGVARTADAAEIRRAYRKLAKTNHPDVNPDDEAAAQRFRDATAAYDLLSDATKRARFDRGEIDASGKERVRNPFGARAGAGGSTGSRRAETADFADIFKDFFGDRFSSDEDIPIRGEDRHFRLTVDFLEAARGGRKRVGLPEGRALEIQIPAGIDDGETLRLAGQGGNGGDMLVEIAVRPHAAFRRIGDDIHLDLPVTIGEAVLGAKIEVPTISGRVALRVPKGSQSGATLRLRGKGIGRAGKQAGDQMVHLRIALPDEITPEFEEAVRALADAHPYDPRRGLPD